MRSGWVIPVGCGGSVGVSYLIIQLVRVKQINILWLHHFNFQLTHTTLENVELLKYFKISKTTPTCFGLQGNHHQGATIST